MVSLLLVGILYALQMQMIQPIFDDLLNPSLFKDPNHIPVFSVWASKIGFHVGREDLFILIPAVLIIIFFLKGVFAYMGKFTLDAVGHRLVTDLRDRLYSHCMGQGPDFFTIYSTGGLISRALSDIERLRTAVSEKLSELTRESFILLGLLGASLYRDWRLTLLSLLAIPLVIFPVSRFSKRLRRVSRRAQEWTAKLAEHMKETLTGIRIVVIYGREGHEEDRFHDSNHRLLTENLKATRVFAVTGPLMEFIGALAVSGILLYGYMALQRGALTLGSFGAFLGTLWAMYIPVKKLSQANNVIQQALAAGTRVFDVLDHPRMVLSPPNPLPVKSPSEFSFLGVDFSYPGGHQALFDVNLKWEAGQRVAIVGASGSGKTTVINLLPRLMDPTEGKITLDGQDIRDMDLVALRNLFGVVTQETVLFDGTVAANIAYGRPEATPEEIREAARIAQAHDFISALPNGYETRLGEAGSGLSGGQSQRIAIARAVIRDPRILLLDEVTSALDPESAMALQSDLEPLMEGRTTVVVSHNLRSPLIRNADILFVMEGGRIAQVGPPSELEKEEGTYRRLLSSLSGSSIEC